MRFHDVPVHEITFKTEYSTDFKVVFALYDENRKDYDYYKLVFKNIFELETQGLTLNSESDLEIYNFDYSLNETFEGRILFVLGSGQPSFEVKLKCSKVELEKTEINEQ